MNKLNSKLKTYNHLEGDFMIIDDESRGLVRGSKCEGFPISTKASDRILELEEQVRLLGGNVVGDCNMSYQLPTKAVVELEFERNVEFDSLDLGSVWLSDGWASFAYDVVRSVREGSKVYCEVEIDEDTHGEETDYDLKPAAVFNNDLTSTIYVASDAFLCKATLTLKVENNLKRAVEVNIELDLEK